jgi:HAD superfamily hydrolase (TIGR01484 family)
MLPISALPDDEAKGIAGLLFDLDDTLLDHGRLGEAAYGALNRLHDSGLVLVAVTGRPSGWGDVLVRQWPIDGVVAENGAIAVLMADGKLRRWDTVSELERSRRHDRLDALATRFEAAFPMLGRTDDAAARRTDVTYDIGESVVVDADTVTAASEWIREKGGRVITSSVHLHLTLDGHDKASGAVHFLRRRLGTDPSICRSSFAFIGDSENDAACFGAFRTTIGVRNLRGAPTVPPRFITEAPRGAGFAEAASALLRARG